MNTNQEMWKYEERQMMRRWYARLKYMSTKARYESEELKEHQN